MAILSDADILDAVRSGALGLDPFEERHLTPNGYDLTVAEVMVPDVHGTDQVFRDGPVSVPPRERFILSTREVVRMPPDVAAQLWLRTSWGRRGVLAQFGKVEAGFSGTLTVPAFNAAAAPVDVAVGDRFCQIVFERLSSSPRRLYAERSGHYQNQRGVTLARDSR